MLRSLLLFMIGTGVIVGSVELGSAQQPKDKAKPKALPRIAIHDPVKLKDDADFLIQGEYEGNFKEGSKSEKIGVQVVAQGDGKFNVKFLREGLPGAGWNGKDSMMFTASREEGKAVIQDKMSKTVGSISNGTLSLKDDDAEVTAKKVERKSSTLGAKAPAGAVVVFGDSADVENWTKGKIAELSDGKFLTVDKTGSIKTKQSFGGMKAHFEFRLAWMPNSRGQGRSNSGVYLQDRYEIQVLDSFGLTGENNECGGIYQAYKPQVNMCLPPMVWQTYDIDFTPAQYADGKKVKNARLTLLHNGVLIHDNVELKGQSGGGQSEVDKGGPFQLQDHGDPLVFRNIWVVEKK